MTVTSAGKAEISNLMINAGTYPTHVGNGTGTTAANVADTTIEAEVETRAATTPTRVTTTVTNDTANYVGTIAQTGTQAITESGLLNASSGGVLYARQVFAAINVVNGDNIQFTWKLKNA